jgi:murein DD-endopeptidase MepM/ murein hydrolase activator NlpD
MINSSNFFNRSISIRDPKDPYKKGKFVDESPEYKSRVFSRVQENPTTKTLLSIRKKVFDIENTFKSLFNLDKKYKKTKQQFDLVESQEQKKKIAPSTNILGNIIQRPKTGFLDAIKNFVTFTFLGWLFTKLQPLIGGLGGIVPLLDGIFDFIGGTIRTLLDIFGSFIKTGYEVKDKIDEGVKGVKQESANIKKTFDDAITTLGELFDSAVKVATSFLDVFGEIYDNTSIAESGKDTPEIESFSALKTLTPANMLKFQSGGEVEQEQRVDVRTPITRGVKKEKRRQVKRKPLIQSQSTVPGKDVGGEEKIKEIYGEETPKFKFDFIPASFLVQSDKKSGFNALRKSSEEYKKPNVDDILGIGNLMGASVDTVLGQKPERRTYTQFADGIRYLVDYGMTNPEEFNKIDLEMMIRRIVEPKVEAAINKIQEEVNKKSKSEQYTADGEVGGFAGGEYGGYSPTSAIEKQIYEYLINEKKLNDIQALGLMANISRESSFIPSNKEPGGTGHGLFQWSHGRVEPFIKAVPDWKTNWKAQIDYALSEPEYLSLVKPGTYQAKTFTSAQEAADWWMNSYLRPRDRSSGSRKHREYLRNIPRSPEGTVKFREPESVSVSVEGGTLPSAQIGSRAGWRWNRMHEGNDYPMSPGTIISSVVGGEVVYAAPMGGYGNTIDIKHPDGSKTRYAHLQNFRVRLGQKVSSGMAIGTVGYTGNVVPPGPAGSHLHFEYIYPRGNKETDWRKLNSIADRKFRFGGNVRPSRVESSQGRFTPPGDTPQSQPRQPLTPTPPNLLEAQKKISDMKPGDQPLIFPGIGKVNITKNEYGTVIKEYYDKNNKKIGLAEFRELFKRGDSNQVSASNRNNSQNVIINDAMRMQLSQKLKSLKRGSGESVRIPGVGTYVAGRDALQRPVEKYFDPSGKPMEEKEFLEKAKRVLERKKYGGLVYKNGTSPTLPEEKYASYNDPGISARLAIQPIIVQTPVPVSSGSNSPILFAVPVVNSSVNSQKLMRS